MVGVDRCERFVCGGCRWGERFVCGGCRWGERFVCGGYRQV